MKSFWMILVAVFALTFSTAAKAELPDPSTGSAAAEHIKNDKIMSCQDLANCNADGTPKPEVKETAYWKTCYIPPTINIVNEDGKYETRQSPVPDWKPGQECKCPEGFSISRSWRLRSKTEKDGVIYKVMDVDGVCLPLNTEPNAEIIAEGLNHLLDAMKRLDLMEKNTNDSITGLWSAIGGHTEQIALTKQQVVALSEDVNALNTFMENACETPNLPASWGKLCADLKQMHEDIENLKYSQKVIRYGLGASYTRYSERNFFGAAGELAFISPRFTPDSPLRLEAVVRGVLGSGEDMEESGDSALALETSVLAGPVFDLDSRGQFKLHTRGFGQQLTKVNGFNAMSRRYGLELALSFAPSAEAGSQGSFYVTPFLNVGHGKSTFQEPATETQSSYVSSSSSITAAGGITFGGQF